MEILHRIGVKDASPDQVYDAITTIDGLAGWWTEETSGGTGVDDVIEFRFIPGGFDMKVTALEPGKTVRWDVVEGPDEWLGTSIEWDLRQDGDYTIVLFKHEGWRDRAEFMHHCSTKWASYLLSLKQLVETGTGAPSPHDLQISDWH